MTNDKMTDETLATLRHLDVAAPEAETRKLALNAAMAAFEVAQAGRKPRRAVNLAARPGWLSGLSWGGLGLPLGTAVAALVLLPLGTQLYHSTALRPNDIVTAPEPLTDELAAKTVNKPKAAQPEMAVAPADTTTTAQVARDSAVATGKVAAAPPPVEVASMAAPKLATPQRRVMVPGAPAPMITTEESAVSGGVALGTAGVMASPQATMSNMVPYVASDDNFAKFDDNRLMVTASDPVSTFSIDVDTASYGYVRATLKDGYLPQPDAVRVEEMLNYFPYDYAGPEDASTPFKANMAVIPTPWNPKTRLLEIGIKGYVPPATERAPENLTFLIDTSGSMEDANKLPLLKRAFGLLVDTLKPTDTVSIVTYAGSAGVALKPTAARERAAILSAIDQLAAEGSTDGVDGVALAYRVNAEAKAAGTVNRVILATDGDFNVGIDTPEALKTFISKERDQGISLSVLGFGRGNLDDALMQALAQNGNGNASYIDSFAEAQKVLVEEGGANLVTIAKDVKIQVEFNPATVSEYRLIGYETRALNREDFNNDAVDAGEIGAGHTVTALYEITPTGSGGELTDPLRYGSASVVPDVTMPSSDELGFLKIRYKAPEGETSQLISTPISTRLAVDTLEAASNDQRFAAAVAAFGQKLRGSAYGAGMSFADIAALASGAKGPDKDGYRAEFVQLVKLAGSLMPANPAPEPLPAD